MRLKLRCFQIFILAFLLSASVTFAQDEGSGSGEAEEAAAEGSGEAEAAADGGSGEATEGSGEAEANGAEGSGEGSGEEECEESMEEGSGDGIEGLLALGDGSKKCKSKSGDDDMSGADALAAALGGGTCDTEGMDEKLAGCLESLGERVDTLEQSLLSGEGGPLEDQITLVLVKKGVIDCENVTQCDDDKACMNSLKEAGRMLCEPVCERHDCPVPYSECVGFEHEASCECKEGFHGNGTVACVPDGFTEEENGKNYRMFDDKYVEWDEAVKHCEELGARLPILDTADTIDIVKQYLDKSNFSVFEQWDRSSRRVWLGLFYDRSTGLQWGDGQRIVSYPASSRLFVWEARRLLSQEASKADSSRHYGFYIDGDIAKLPGGGRRGAAILCELLPQDIAEPTSQSDYNDPYQNQRRQQQTQQQQQNQGRNRQNSNDERFDNYYNPSYRYPNNDGGYPDYHNNRQQQRNSNRG